MDTQALSITCKHMQEHGSSVVADLKKQLANERRLNTILRRRAEDFERDAKLAGAGRLDAMKECDRLRTHITVTASVLLGLGRQCDEHRRRIEAAKWSE